MLGNLTLPHDFFRLLETSLPPRHARSTKFDTEGVSVESIKAQTGASWLIDLAQDSTAAEIREQVCVDPDEEVEVDSSRGSCNLQIGWGGRSRRRVRLGSRRARRACAGSDERT